MDGLIQTAPQLVIAAFMLYAFRWLVQHFDPHIVRLLDSIDDIRETGQRMADIGDRLVRLVESQQEWQENLDEVLTERHKRIMERFDALAEQHHRVIYRLAECPGLKKQEEETNEYV
jgi:hypothetical protein